MKCNICGKEFGNSVKCEHCGADRVAALGNYSGYTPSIVHNSVNNAQAFSASPVCNETKEIGFSVCYACGEVIPADAMYCPKCAKKLYETCPKCGKTYSSQYTICQYCGTDRIKYIEEQQRIEKQKREEQERQKRIRAMEAQREAQQRAAQEAEKRRLKQKQEQKEARETIIRMKAEGILRNIENKMESRFNKSMWICVILIFAFVFLAVWSESKFGESLIHNIILGIFFLLPFCYPTAFAIVMRNYGIRLINDYINAHPKSPESKYLLRVRNLATKHFWVRLTNRI